METQKTRFHVNVPFNAYHPNDTIMVNSPLGAILISVVSYPPVQRCLGMRDYLRIGNFGPG